MSDTAVSNSLSSPAPPVANYCSCCNATTLKISLFVIGMLLIIGAITTYCLHVNAVAVYSMGGTGGVLIIGIVIASVIQCISRGRVEEARNWALQSKSEEEERVNKERLLWWERVKSGEREVIEVALTEKSLPIEDLNYLLDPAVLAGHAELVRVLIQHGADPSRLSTSDELGYCALHWAVINRDDQKSLDTMRVLLELKPELVSVQALLQKLTPLLLASGWRKREDGAIHLQKIELLLDKGAFVNATDSVMGDTPLHREAESCRWHPNIEVIEALVRKGADRHAKNRAGLTPLQIIERDHSTWMEDPAIQRRLKAVFDNN